MTLEKLLADGRIHPARIEETFDQATCELDAQIQQAGEDAAFQPGVQGLDREIVRTLGRLKFRTSYGQNVLAHSVECAQLASMMAQELDASPKTAARAALLHDIGKAVTHEVEGTHALDGGEMARRHGESEAVAQRVHAMQAGREVRVIVEPGRRGVPAQARTTPLNYGLRVGTRASWSRAGVDRVRCGQCGRSRTRRRAAITPGSNCAPAPARSSALAASSGIARR